MKKWILWWCLLFIFLCPSKILAATNYYKGPGIAYRLWDNGEDYNATCPNCGPMGGILVLPWRDCDAIDENNYSCPTIDQYASRTVNMKVTLPDQREIPRPFLIQVAIYQSPGDFTPERVYQGSGGATKIYDCQDRQMPNYGDSKWKSEYFRLARALANEYGDHPQIAGFLFGVGYDDEAYPTKGCSNNPDPSHGYGTFLIELSAELKRAFVNRGKKPVYILAGGSEYTATVVNAALANGIGVKSATISGPADLGKIRYQDDNFRSSGRNWPQLVGSAQFYDPYNILPWSAAIKTADQTSWAFEDGKPFGIGDPGLPQGVYFQVMTMLYLHADWFDIRDAGQYGTLGGKLPWVTRQFIPTYLNKTKTNTPGVWIAFKEVRNPNICDDATIVAGKICSVYPPPVNTNILCWHESGERGVCETHVLGDYGFFLQKVADSGSLPKFVNNLRGVSDFPAPASRQAYGFGRELPDGKYMGMKIEDGAWMKGRGGNIKMRLIVLNSGGGQVQVEFRKSNGSVFTETITKGTSLGNIDEFVVTERDIAGVKFDGSLPDGADVVIRSAGGSSIIHLLELITNGTPAATPTQNPLCVCPAGMMKYLGNANCDDKIDGVDFEIWREEFSGARLTTFADFNCDHAVNEEDFETWKRNWSY